MANYEHILCMRSHQTGKTVTDGFVEPVRETDGPYRVAICCARSVQTPTERGYTEYATKATAIAPDTKAFGPGDRLAVDGKEIWEVESARTYPTEQILEVMRL